jgi:hypothetical protein
MLTLFLMNLEEAKEEEVSTNIRKCLLSVKEILEYRITLLIVC